MKKTKIEKLTEEELRERYNFEYIRKHFFDIDYDIHDITKDIVDVYNDNLELTQLSAEGKNTVRVTNYFVRETQLKATSIRAKMSPYNAIFNDDALCQIFNRIYTHPRFFNLRADVVKKLKSQGYDEIMAVDTTKLEDGIQKENIQKLQEDYRDQINMADVREVRRAVAHIPSFHRVSQFPNHVAQRIYERYAPINGGVILDSSCGWGNRMMAAMSSKYHYKYIGTDPNSEMHNNYYALAETIWKTLYETNTLTHTKKFPHDYIDIRDQGSEFDIPEWHNNSGYDLEELKKQSDELTKQNKEGTQRFYEAHGFTHPVNSTGKGICDTGTLNTTGLKLPPIMRTHDEDIYYSGIGDLSFTSPPYFALECYTEDSFKGNLSDGQSAGKGDNYPRWVKEFMYPTIINHFNYLKPGGYYTYNLKDLPKDKMYLYSDWLSVCLDVGFELIEQPEMILKSRRQFGKKEDGTDRIDYKGATEKIGVLRKPLKHTDFHIAPDNNDAMYHIMNNFNYSLMSVTRPEGFLTRLPDQLEEYLKDKFKDLKYVLVKKS